MQFKSVLKIKIEIESRRHCSDIYDFVSRSELLKLVEDGVVCPMCVETIAISDIK